MEKRFPLCAHLKQCRGRGLVLSFADYAVGFFDLGMMWLVASRPETKGRVLVFFYVFFGFGQTGF